MFFLSEMINQSVKKAKLHAANLLTLINLSLGGYAIIAILKNQLTLGLLLIFIAALADRFDGLVARRLNIESELGKQLDSMSDIISFGLAPALLIYQAVLFQFGAPGAFFTIMYIACGALRLAKFNISENQTYFIGLPITAAGCLATLSFLAVPHLPAHAFSFIIVSLALLMIAPFKIKKV